MAIELVTGGAADREQVDPEWVDLSAKWAEIRADADALRAEADELDEQADVWEGIIARRAFPPFS